MGSDCKKEVTDASSLKRASSTGCQRSPLETRSSVIYKGLRVGPGEGMGASDQDASLGGVFWHVKPKGRPLEDVSQLTWEGLRIPQESRTKWPVERDVWALLHPPAPGITSGKGMDVY